MIQIIEKNNKKYLVSSIKKNGKYIDCSQFFNDLKELNDKICKEQNIDHLDRNYPTQRILNKFSGGYISPSMMKSYMTDPATCFIQAISPVESTDSTEIGRTIHKCFEEFYNLEPKDRDLSKIDEFLNKNISKFKQQSSKDILIKYITGFKETKDYLDQTKDFPHKEVTCYNEYFVKSKLKPLGIEIPLPVYCVADRVDYRDGKLYIGDYKTGTFLRKGINTIEEGYLGSMIMYKWAIEQDFGLPVEAGFLFTPGCEQKIVPLDMGLVNQSKYLEKVIQFCEKFQKEAQNHIYEFTGKGYFTSKALQKFKNIMETMGDVVIPIEYDITVQENNEEDNEDINESESED